MELPYSEKLSINYLSKLFDKKSESYKLFWFQAIVNKVISGKQELTYNELVDEMVADAWYMVSEYKLNLGPFDKLEALVHYVKQISNMKTSEKKENIIRFLENCDDKKVREMKRTLTYNVPYRLQAPFMQTLRGKEWDTSETKLIEKINRERRLMYYFTELSGMMTRIYIQPEWYAYINQNQEVIKGWIQYNLIIYLQRRNPSVPGISNKLDPPQTRKLNLVTRYWKMIMELAPIRDIYGQELLTKDNLSIDHFVPWSYVAHDEFWNLNPTTKRINSSKSNYLPEWERYFPALCEMEYFSYQMMWKYEGVHKEFEKCRNEHINSDDVFMRLYREGIEKDEFASGLHHVLFPVFEAAKGVGFIEWEVQTSSEEMADL